MYLNLRAECSWKKTHNQPDWFHFKLEKDLCGPTRILWSPHPLALLGDYFTISLLSGNLQILFLQVTKFTFYRFCVNVTLLPIPLTEKTVRAVLPHTLPSCLPPPVYTAFSSITANHLWRRLSSAPPVGQRTRPLTPLRHLSPSVPVKSPFRSLLDPLLNIASEHLAVPHSKSKLFCPCVPTAVTSSSSPSSPGLLQSALHPHLAPETALGHVTRASPQLNPGVSSRHVVLGPLAASGIISGLNDRQIFLNGLPAPLAALGLFSTRQSERSCVVSSSVDWVLSHLG